VVGGGPEDGTVPTPESTPEFVRVGPGYPENDFRPSYNTDESGRKLRFHGYTGETPDFIKSGNFYRGHQETQNQEATVRSAPGGELETEIVHPPPAPSSEVAASGSALGGEVGGGTDKEPAQDVEPLSKKKAREWDRIKDLDHEKVSEEARSKANKASAEIKAKIVTKKKDDTKRQNIEEITANIVKKKKGDTKRQNIEELFQPDGTSRETPPAKAPPGSAKAREAQPQPSPLSCLEDLTVDLGKTKPKSQTATTKGKPPPRPSKPRNKSQTAKPPTNRGTAAE
jgi:hypothetical protein